MSSIEQSGTADWQRLFNSGIRQTRQAFLLGACLADREKWIESVKRVGSVGDWSYEFQPLVEMLTGDLKPTPVNVANSKRRLNLSDKSPRTILEQCAIWLRIAVLEITRDELEYSKARTSEAEIVKGFEHDLANIGLELDQLRESLEVVK